MPKSYIPFLLLFFVPFLVYSNSLFGQFVYDDKVLTVEENPALTGDASVWDILSWDRPVREFTYLFDHAIWGFNPVGYHLQNILWHCANTLLLFWLLQSVGVSQPVSFWSALLFSVHPINTEAVAWISGRKELLCLFFELSACLFFVRAAQPGKPFSRTLYLFSLLCCILALLSKQVAVVLPIFLFLTAWFQAANKETNFLIKQTAKRLILPFLIVLFFTFFKYTLLFHLNYIQEQGTFYDPGSRNVTYTLLSAILTPFATFFQSLWLCLWPLDLTIERMYPPVVSILDIRWIPGALIALSFSVIIWQTIRRMPGLSFGIAWFCLAWLPLCGALPVAYLVADRYLYIPSLGFSIALASIFFSKQSKINQAFSRLSMAVCLILCILFSLRTLMRNNDWKDEITLWQSAVHSRPNNPKALSGLAHAYADTGNTSEAKRLWKKSLDLLPYQPQIWVNMGNMEKQLGNIETAKTCYLKALELYPQYGTAHFNLGVLFDQTSEKEKALHHFQLASKYLYHRVNTAKRKGLAHYHIARLLFEKGEKQAALQHLVHAEKWVPTYSPIYNLMGLLHIGDPPQARAYFQKALSYDPSSADAYFNLGLLEWNQGNTEKAIRFWEKAVDINPHLQQRINTIKENSVSSPQK